MATCRPLLVLGIALAGVAVSARAVTSSIPAEGLPTATHYAQLLLPQTPGVVSWQTLGRVEIEQVGIRTVTRFSKEILALDQKDVKLQGFIVPLEVGTVQKRFLISAVPPECPFCLPAGPEALVEVLAKAPLRYGPDAVVVSGRFSVIKDDYSGLLYRLTDAQWIGTVPLPAAQRRAGKPRP